MADLKLFKISNSKVQNKQQLDLKLEKEIQRLCEENLQELFGIRFLASEYTTGNKHGGRIDSLGIDENNCPVIIEYKLDSKENVINQGLFYLDWLMDHKAEFEMLCLEKLGKRVDVDWTNPRLLCIARDFTKYDDYAIGQINRNIELIRYRLFEDGYIIFELTSTSAQTKNENKVSVHQYKGIKEYHQQSSSNLNKLFEELEHFILSLGDDVQKKELKYYYAYSRIRNFVCLEIRPKDEKILLYMKIKYSDIENKHKIMRDVTKIGHYGTGDTEATINSIEDLDIIKPLIEKSYNLS